MDLGLQYEELKCYSCVLDTVVRREGDQESIVSDSDAGHRNGGDCFLPHCFCAAVVPERESSPARVMVALGNLYGRGNGELRYPGTYSVPLYRGGGKCDGHLPHERTARLLWN